MKTFISLVAAAGLACLSFSAPARADTAAELFQKYLGSGRIDEADEKLLSLAAAATNNADAQLGLGMVRTARAFEKLSQSLYRHGFGSKSDGLEMFIGTRPGDLAINPNPQPITYEQFRAILTGFVTDLSSAEQALASVGDRPAKLTVDLSVARFDWNGDGNTGPEDHFGLAIAGANEKGEPLPFIVGFDTADAKWMQGYDKLVMAVTKAWLSHDFSETWDTSFAVLFPKAVSTMSAANGADIGDPTMFGVRKAQADDIADYVSLIHTIRWPVSDPTMWREVRDHLKKVAALNRETWALIDKETDDDHEWLPGPKQKSGVLPSMNVTPERIATWLAALSKFEATLDGKALVPHWRFDKGVNLAKVFEDPRPFDLVLWITGPAAVPYLQDGPVMNQDEWDQITRVFDGNFASYAFYFN